MMSSSTFESVARVLSTQLNVDEADIQTTSSLADDLGADSLDAVELVMSLEEEFGITIETTDAESLSTVADVVELVDSLVK